MFEWLEARKLLAGDGLTGLYYDNSDFTTLKLTRVDPVVSFPWWQNAPVSTMGKDDFSVRWTGILQVPTTGSYTFDTWSSDGARLYINNNVIINAWTAHQPRYDYATPMTLTAGQKYAIQLDYFSAKNSAEISLEWAAPGSARAVIPQSALTSTSDITPPTVPANVASTAQTASSVKLGWTASTDDIAVTGYEIDRNGTKVGTSATPTYTDTGLTAGTTYAYTIRAYDAAGNFSPFSTAVNAATLPPDTTPPSTPDGLVQTAATYTGVTLGWNPSTDDVAVTGYEIDRNGTKVGTSATPTYTDTGLASGTTYAYTIRSYDAAGNFSPFTTATNATTVTADTAPPSTPGGLTQTAATYTGLTLGWNPSTDNVAVDHYDVLRNGTKVGSVTGTTFADTGLAIGTSYNYTVLAYDAAGNASAASTLLAASTLSDTVAPSIPQGLTAPSKTNTTVTLNWTASTDNIGVTRYDIYRAGAKVGSATGTSFTDTGLTASTSYSYAVAAVDAAGNTSTISSAIAVTTTAVAVQNGLTGQYYDNANFTNLKLTRTDSTVSFPWWQDSPDDSIGDDDFSVKWTGQVQANTTGSYTFTTWSSDGVRLWVNGALVIDAWASHMPRFDNSAAITLQAGQRYNIRMDYYSGTNSAEIALEWKLPGASSATVIPSSQLFNAYLDNTAPTAPLYPAATVKTSDNILVSWAQSTDDLAVSKYDVYRNGNFIGSTTGTSLRDTGLTASTAYSYVVRAEDAAGNLSAASSTLSTSTIAAGTQTLYEAETAVISGATVSGNVVTSLDPNDYLKLSNVNLGTNTPTLDAYVSVPESQVGGSFQIRLDGPTGAIVGTLVLQTTGLDSSAPYVLQHTSLTGATGVHDVYLVATGGTSIASVDWVQFSPTKLTKIMPVGDSITQGAGGFASYRYLLYKRLEASGYAVDFVGSQTSAWLYAGSTDPLYFDFDQNNEGHAGWRADQFVTTIGAWTQTYQPDIAMIHLGTNDIFQSQTNASTITDITQVIAAMRAVNPNLKIALAQIIPSTQTPSQFTDLNSRIATLAAQQNTLASQVLLVDQWTGFNAATDTIEGTHPNAIGEAKMVDKWWAALLQLI